MEQSYTKSLSNVRYVLVCCTFAIMFTSCRTLDKAVFCQKLKDAQLGKASQSMVSMYLFPKPIIEKIHYYRENQVINKLLKLKIRDGYVYTIDQYGGGYSASSGHGVIWTADEEVHYNFTAFSKELNVFEYKEDIPVSDLFLLKNAIMQWDLNQINKYYKAVVHTEPGCYVGSRVLVRNGEIVDIQTYFWHE